MRRVTLDFETRSEADLKRVGAWAYSEHPSTEIICVCWSTNRNRPKGVLWPGKMMLALRGLAEDPEVVFEAHNAAFEYSIWENVLHKRCGWPRLEPRRWRDTMATACYYALPAALDKLCKVLGLPGKDPRGDKLIQTYCKLHNKTAKRDIPEGDQQAFLEYCAQDVEQEEAVGNLLGDLPEREEEYFLQTFEMNARGLYLDAPGILAAQHVVKSRQDELAAEFREIVGFNPTQRDEVLRWLNERLDPPLETLQKDELAARLKEGVKSRDAREAVRLRLEHAKTSTTKLDAMLRQRGSDGKARFQVRYHGAVTGRPTGSGFQPLNLVRSWEDVEPDRLVADIKLGSAPYLRAVYGDAMEAVSKALRHYITASPGCRIMAGDFSSVEAVVNACLSAEEWKVQLFRDGKDPYCAFASTVTGREVLPKDHPNVTVQDKLDRQKFGKPGELAGGYQGWIGAWRKFDKTGNFTDEQVSGNMGVWRGMHPRIVGGWRWEEHASLEVVARPDLGPAARFADQDDLADYGGTVYRGAVAEDILAAGGFGYEMVDNWLTMILSNGKRLWYWRPFIKWCWPPHHDPEEREDCAAGECDCRKRQQVLYWAMKNGKWGVQYSYGGKKTENRVQATCREMLEPCALSLVKYGYPVALTVYDELVCDVPKGHGSADEYLEIVAETVAGLDWARGWPITMGSPILEGGRYRK